MSGKRAGSTATYECDPGYVLIGESVDIINRMMDLLLLMFAALIGTVLWIGR